MQHNIPAGTFVNISQLANRDIISFGATQRQFANLSDRPTIFGREYNADVEQAIPLVHLADNAAAVSCLQGIEHLHGIKTPPRHVIWAQSYRDLWHPWRRLNLYLGCTWSGPERVSDLDGLLIDLVE